MQQHAQTREEQVSEVRHEVASGLDLDEEWQLAAPDGRQQFFTALNGTFGPAMLLRFEAVHIDWQLRRRDNVREENEAPAGELRTVTEIEVFAQRVVLPAAGLLDARATPQACRAIEIEEPTAATAGRLFQKQMPVEEHGLHT